MSSLGNCCRAWNAYASSSGLMLRKMKTYIGFTDDLIRLGCNVSDVAAKAASMTGNTLVAQQSEAVKAGWDSIGSFVGLTKAANLWHQCLTGALFFEIEENGTFKRREDNSGNRQLRPALSVAADVARMIGKTATSAKWFSEIGLYSLGQHADKLGGSRGVGFGCSVVATSMEIVSNSVTLVSAIKEKDNTVDARSKVVEALANWICSLFDILSLPFEAGTIIGLSPVMALVGAIFALVSAVINLLKDIVFSFKCSPCQAYRLTAPGLL